MKKIRRTHLQEARQAKGMSAIDLAEQAELTLDKVYQVERGRYGCSMAEAERWAATLNMTPAEAFPELFAEGGA